MELTIDEALQQGVAAYKEGKVQDAERLYRAVLQAQPKHPDANYNMGVLASELGNPLEAIPFFKLALNANTKVDQFWLSYIDALIKLERFDEAKRVLVEGEASGVSSEKLKVFRQQIQTLPFDEKKTARQGLKVSEKRRRLAEKKKRKKEKKRATSSDAAPSQNQINRLIEHYQSNRFAEAEELARSITQQFPKHSFGWKALGATLQQTGKFKESLMPLERSVALSPHDAEALSNLGNALRQVGRLDEAKAKHDKAIALRPDYAEAHNNLGNTLRDLGNLEQAAASLLQAIALKPNFADARSNLGLTLKELGRLDDAAASFRQAIAVNPDCADAHNNLGSTLKELGRLDEANASLRQAIALKPNYAEAHSNLGNTLQELGRQDESISCFVRAISLKADFDGAYFNLGLALENVRFREGDQSLSPILINLLSKGNLVRPKSVAMAVLSLLRVDGPIEDVLRDAASLKDIEEVDRAIKALAQAPLLHQLMRICPLPDLQLEALFVSMRRVILTGLGQIEASPEFIHFLSTLSLHCFTNEYVYFETEEESGQINVLEAAIAENIGRALQPTITQILILATYRPLHQYDWSGELQVLNQLPDVKVRLLEEPLAERVIAQNILGLSSIEDDVSRKVREQYEANPYPRWERLRIPPKAYSIAEICNEIKLQLHSENIKNAFSPSILIAGCGTGRQSIETATRFANCKVTAVDLSRTSLAYAQRKTFEFGIANIKYLQADILNLRELGQEFDIIESAGVLHHMDDPMVGWQALVGLLKTGGLMKIGLYSDLARRHIVKTQEDIALRGIGTSEAAIRQFRQSLIESHDEHHQQLAHLGDFFSLSEVRDLVFHVQEHRFTLEQIQHCIDHLGLKFCGFENTDIVRQFKHSFGEDTDAYDLSLWHQFEESHPSAFAGMYQFWCQKL